MNELLLIQSRIYEIREQKVVLDFNLAEMYQVETRVLNQSVKRNINRFPDDLMFRLTSEEWKDMSSRAKRPKTSVPLAFTEHGVVMQPSVLRSDIAIQTGVLIVRAFVAIRQLISNSPVDRVGELEKQMQKLRPYMDEVFADYNDINDDSRVQLELINQTLAALQAQKNLANKPHNLIGFRK